MFDLVPIGIARTPFANCHKMPRHGAGPASIEIYPAYAQALEGLERCSHVWVFGYFDEAARDVLQAVPRKHQPDAPARGVFSMRSPVRPNPIGLSSARLLQISGTTLHLDRLDFRDGTPIVDLKPYSPSWDLLPAALDTHPYDLLRYSREEMQQALELDAQRALGTQALSQPLVRQTIGALLLLVCEAGLNIRSRSVLFEVDHPDARVDLLLCATGASFGNGRLTLGPQRPQVVLTACAGDSRIEAVCRSGADGQAHIELQRV